MKKMKNFLIGVLIISLINLSVGVTASAFSVDAEEIDESIALPSVFDDFSSYTPEMYDSFGTDMQGGWRTATTDECDRSTINIGYDGSRLKISTNTKSVDPRYNSSYAGVFQTAVYMGDGEGLYSGQKIKVKAKKTHQSDMWGIRFCVHEGEGGELNYYTLFFGGMYTYAATSGRLSWGLYKSKDGSITKLTEKESKSGVDKEDGYMGTGNAELEVSFLDGKIDWNLTSTKDSVSYGYNETFIDDEPFKVSDAETTVHLYAAGSDDPSRFVYFDDFFVQKNVPFLSSEEPYNVLYAELKGNSFADENGIIDFGEEYPVRIIKSPLSANHSFDLFLSNDKSEWKTVKGCKFNAEGVWLNDKVASAYRYAALSTALPDDLEVLTDADENKEYAAISGGELKLYAKFGEITDNASFEWLASDDSGTVENGLFKAARRGSVTVSATYENRLLEINITVQSELDLARKNDTVAEYINSKKDIVNEINSGITQNDSDIIVNVIKNTGDKKIKDISDIESEKITALEGEKLSSYIERIKSYGEFAFDTLEDIFRFIEAFENEYYVGLTCNESDREALKAVFEERNAFLDLPLDNYYYEKYKDEVLEKLINRKYKNVFDLRKAFKEAYTLTALNKALSAEMTEELLEKCKEEIGYDEEKYNKNKGYDLYAAIISNKTGLTTAEKLKNFIDGYNKPQKSEDGGSRKTGGGNGSSGRSTVTVPASYIQEVNEKTLPKKIENKSVQSFADVPESHWAFEDITRLFKADTVSGYPDGTFKPEAFVTRAEFLKLTGCITEEEDITAAAHEFSDVSEDDWYYKYFLKAYPGGTVLGDQNGNLRPNDNISREEMALIIYRILKKQGKIKKAEKAEYSDFDMISEWAVEAVSTLSKMGIFTGNENGEFRPSGKATRAETAAVIGRVMAAEGEIK